MNRWVSASDSLLVNIEVRKGNDEGGQGTGGRKYLTKSFILVYTILRTLILSLFLFRRKTIFLFCQRAELQSTVG